MDNAVVVLVVPAICGIVALIMGAFAIAAFRQTRRWRTEGVTVEGEVVGFIKRELQSRDNIHERDERIQKYSPELTFFAEDGKSYRFTASAVEPQDAYTLGQRLPVRYLPDTPQRADLEKMAVSNIPGIAFSILSFLTGSVAYLVFTAS